MDLLFKIIASHKAFLNDLGMRQKRQQPSDVLVDVFEAIQARFGGLYTAYLANSTPQLVAEDTERSPKLKQAFSVRLAALNFAQSLVATRR